MDGEFWIGCGTEDNWQCDAEDYGKQKMKPKAKFEFWRWSYSVVMFLLGGALIFFVAEAFAGPFLRWLLHGMPYTLPTWNRVGRMALAVLFIAVACGTIAWYYEKHQSGR